MILTQFGKRVKVFCYDNAREYLAHPLVTFFQDERLHETSCAYTPQQNGIAEKKSPPTRYGSHALVYPQYSKKVLG